MNINKDFDKEMEKSYHKQALRIARSFNRLMEDMKDMKVADDTKDNYIHFAQDCWHLKDWIKNDDSVNKDAKNNIEHFVGKSKYISDIGAFANATKHCKLDSRWTKLRGKNPEPKLEVVYIPSKTGTREILCLNTGKVTWLSSTLPTNVLKDWNIFFNKYNLVGRFEIREDRN